VVQEELRRALQWFEHYVDSAGQDDFDRRLDELRAAVGPWLNPYWQLGMSSSYPAPAAAPTAPAASPTNPAAATSAPAESERTLPPVIVQQLARTARGRGSDQGP
jgi:hypothetical protein